jgi:hypothetical protein
MRIAVILSALSVVGCASSSNVAAVSSPFHLHVSDTSAADEAAAASIDGMPAADEPAPSALPLMADDKSSDEKTYITVMYGNRQLRDSNAKDLGLGRQPIYGAEIEGFDASDGNGYEAGVQYAAKSSNSSGNSTETRLTEFYGGYRKTFRADQSLQPYVSVGLSVLDGAVDFGTNSGDDTAFGVYVRAGLNWAFDRLRFGIDYKHLFASLDLAGANVDADYDQIALTAGFAF